MSQIIIDCDFYLFIFHSDASDFSWCDSLLLGGKDIRFLWETLGQVSSRNAHIMRYPERYLFCLLCCLTYFSSSAFRENGENKNNDRF